MGLGHAWSVWELFCAGPADGWDEKGLERREEPEAGEQGPKVRGRIVPVVRVVQVVQLVRVVRV